MSAHWDEYLKLKTLFDTELRCPLQQDEYHMLHLVCASRTPPSSPKPPRSHSNKPQENSPGPTVGQRWLETSFHTFHHHHSTFHHPAHCCTPSLRFEGEKYLQLTVTFTALDELPSSTCWSAAVATYRREQWWSQAEGWSLPLSSDVFTGYAQVKKKLQIKNYHEVKSKICKTRNSKRN